MPVVPVVPATWEAEVGGSRSEVSPNKVSSETLSEKQKHPESMA
jgi:hypothetical protein